MDSDIKVGSLVRVVSEDRTLSTRDEGKLGLVIEDLGPIEGFLRDRWFVVLIGESRNRTFLTSASIELLECKSLT
jgi:hypothetical protein